MGGLACGGCSRRQNAGVTLGGQWLRGRPRSTMTVAPCQPVICTQGLYFHSSLSGLLPTRPACYNTTWAMRYPSRCYSCLVHTRWSMSRLSGVDLQWCGKQFVLLVLPARCRIWRHMIARQEPCWLHCTSTGRRPTCGVVVMLRNTRWGGLGLWHCAEVNLVTALVPSDMACLASSPGRSRRTAVWMSRDVTVGCTEARKVT